MNAGVLQFGGGKYRTRMKKNQEANPAQASAPINRRDLLAMTARETRYSARNAAIGSTREARRAGR